MRNALITAAAVLALVGCRSYASLDHDLPALVGTDVQLITNRLGDPDQQDVVMGDKVYMWHLSFCTLYVTVDATEHVVRSNYAGGRAECDLMTDRIGYKD